MKGDSLSKLIKCMKAMSVKKGKAVYKAGDNGDKFFVVAEGTLKYEPQKGNADAGAPADYAKKQYFGDSALVYDAPRKGTVTATSNCSLFWLNREIFRRLTPDPGQEIEKLDQRKHFKEVADQTKGQRQTTKNEGHRKT